MNLHTAVTQYVTYRQSLGYKSRSNEEPLKRFVRVIGLNKNLSDVQAKEVDAFLAGKGPVTSNWFKKHQALRGFYHYVISRGYTTESPLPVVIPKRPQAFIPYIYNVKELRALLDVSLTYQKRRGCHRIKPYTVNTFLLLLYGAGLRSCEAINLTLADVDLSQALLTIRETKFYKTRLVPLGPQLTQSLSQYASWRQVEGYSQNPQAPFFPERKGEVIHYHNINIAFRRIRKIAGVKREEKASYQPRLHDLRHTFAVHRLTAWYKEGADVQKLLPVLSVYLGHDQLSSTSVYLTMTPALLEEAGKLFQRYVYTEVSNE